MGKKNNQSKKKPNLNQKFQQQDRLKFIYTNADQLKNKLTELNQRIMDTNPDIIGITEVKAKNRLQDMSAAEFNVESTSDYQMLTETWATT